MLRCLVSNQTPTKKHAMDSVSKEMGVTLIHRDDVGNSLSDFNSFHHETGYRTVLR